MENENTVRITMEKYDEMSVLEGRVNLLVMTASKEKYLSKETILRCLGVKAPDVEPDKELRFSEMLGSTV